ncbi:AAA-like domain-containing protein [Nostoc sp. CALU 1950]|uniref:AAA-like domain-containing protein n=1 Tax=Nostoc sp. CALU 1950 TaxID=3104321 RepID=UPI003EC0C366
MLASSSNFYQVGASLPIDAPSYVQRQADEEFYQKLRSGKFCYVLNSRQMGKSSLRVQTMQKLQQEGTICAAIDLTGIGKHNVTQSQWYGGIVYALVESCQLEDKFDFNWQIWWREKQEILDPVMCLRLFIEQVLLEKIQQPIVIFVDEIDRVLSQDFSSDDFFALIRFFQNQRVDNPKFERLTFALLGVATPSDLITDKTQTPFNIGEGIELHGFRMSEVQPLIKGLEGKVSNPQKVIESILDCTGGQPFLTQKLCKFMVEESEKDNPRSVAEVVIARIIENWEFQDNPEHLRTIRDRILSNEQRASYLLELYQQIRQLGEIDSNNSIEVSELQLSGLVVKNQKKLKVYNPIYREVFNESWVERQLETVRDAENLRRELSELVIKLRNQSHKFPGDEVLIFASLAKEFQDHKVEKAILLSHLSLAYLELEEFQKAEEKVKIALEYLDNNEAFQGAMNDLDNNRIINSVFQKLQTLVYAYYAQGSLFKKQGDLENAIKAYMRAFKILRYTLEKEIDILNKEILPLEIIESIHKNLIELFNNKQNTDFATNDVICSLIKYLFIHYTPIQKLLEAKDWKKADEETYRLMTQKMGKKGIQILVRSDFENFPLEDLYVVNALWEKYSDAKFGFRRQKEIWLKSGSIGQARLAPVIKFWQAVGWISEGELEEIELNEINYQLQQEKTLDGYLPTTGLRFQEVSLLSRFASCDVSFFDSLMSK